METWIVLAVAGAFLQNVRSGLQKALTPELQVLGAAYSRFIFALPFALIYLWWLGFQAQLNLLFFCYVALGALSQVAGAIFLLQAFTTQNFAVATALSKTETVQTLLLSVVVLGEWISPVAGVGVLFSLAGLWLINGRKPGEALIGRGTWLGLAAGLGLAGAAVFYRAAALSLPELSYLHQAAWTLALALCLQTLGLGAWMVLRARDDFNKVIASWPKAVWVGLAGFLTSVCWFSAMALVNAAYVRALGQLELLFSFALSVFWFRERASGIEVIGAVVLSAGILVVLLGR